MKLSSFRQTPAVIAAAVIGLIFLFQLLSYFFPRFTFFERLEWISYDWRVKQALARNPPVADNLAAVFIDDASLDLINDLYQFNWPWPRFLHGEIVQELSAQGARAVGFDILFRELHPRFTGITVDLPDGGSAGSDEFFALQMARSGKAVLAAMGETTDGRWSALLPAEMFRTNALAVGHITSEADADGVLRRALPYRDDPVQGRIWHLAILLAAQALEIDLGEALVERRRIVLQNANGVRRIIPLDAHGFFHINWNLRWNDSRLTQLNYPVLLHLNRVRWQGSPEEMARQVEALREAGAIAVEDEAPFRNKVVVIGSIGAGNNIADMGATPIETDTYLVSKHWNIANSVLTGEFVRRSPLALDLVLILMLGALAAVLTWRLKAVIASACVLAAIVGYVILATETFVQTRFWLPVVLPVAGAMLMTHVCMVTYRVVFEQNERRRVKAVFSRIVSPDVVHELLSAEKLNLGGARRRVTVFFADVRGFTRMTDENHARAEEYVRSHGLQAEEAEAFFNEQARLTLETVNLYLATIADRVKEHDGTLDKYMGDCVMAFWGAPVPNDRHALSCVRAAIQAQRAIYDLNQRRCAENNRREGENARRAVAGERPLPMLALLSLGTGIHTGEAIVGLMGSDDHILNYTVFGREVNLASRLEGVSGRGRIIISEATFYELQRDDPELAALCVAQSPVTVKGIRGTVRIYEVPWKESAPAENPSTVSATPRNAPVPGVADPLLQ